MCPICKTVYTNDSDLLLIEIEGACSGCGKAQADLDYDNRLLTEEEENFYNQI